VLTIGTRGWGAINENGLPCCANDWKVARLHSMLPTHRRFWRGVTRLFPKMGNESNQRARRTPATPSRFNYMTARSKRASRTTRLMSDINELSFEAAYAELETIIEKLE